MTAPPTLAERQLSFAGEEVRFLAIADLDPFVDAEQLLGVGEVPEPPYWMHLWPGASSLSRRLAVQCEAGQRVLELGCGLGVPSLVAALRGAAVVATDWQRDPLQLLRRSARLNQVELGLVQMDWRRLCVRGAAFDLVAGADVAYDAGEEEGLVTALAAAVRRGGRVMLADSVNTYRQGLAERLRTVGFDVREERDAEEEEGRVVWVRILEGTKL